MRLPSERGQVPPMVWNDVLAGISHDENRRAFSRNYDLSDWVGAAAERYLMLIVAGLQLTATGVLPGGLIALQANSNRGWSGAALGYDSLAQLRLLVAASSADAGKGCLACGDSAFARPLLSTNESRQSADYLIYGEYFFTGSDEFDHWSSHGHLLGGTSLRPAPLHTALGPTAIQTPCAEAASSANPVKT
jgi:hypothetical protein